LPTLFPYTTLFRSSLWRPPAVEEGPQDGRVPGDAAERAPGRLRGAAWTQGDRGAVEVRHGGHVRQGDPGHAAGRRRGLGCLGDDQDLLHIDTPPGQFVSDRCRSGPRWEKAHSNLAENRERAVVRFGIVLAFDPDREDGPPCP